MNRILEDILEIKEVFSVLKKGSQSNKFGNKIHKNANKTETKIYAVHPIWATSTEKLPVLSSISSHKPKGYNL